ncbi:hypothetical protein FDP41_009440 [Naegleria fowleri]|uniref:Ubiquitin-like domain-containing protein n=1 Tax=Naegleria fowleri TaxID=5763 RepID=A0A6A5B2Y6_NAEFO|nr:uncharacterized protein FDP41_009440 [Naegleria fowleri]KAF0972537.1 hypothetical protein FDP41_009440 [Naegleria fowleri]
MKPLIDEMMHIIVQMCMFKSFYSEQDQQKLIDLLGNLNMKIFEFEEMKFYLKNVIEVRRKQLNFFLDFFNSVHECSALERAMQLLEELVELEKCSSQEFIKTNDMSEKKKQLNATCKSSDLIVRHVEELSDCVKEMEKIVMFNSGPKTIRPEQWYSEDIIEVYEPIDNIEIEKMPRWRMMIRIEMVIEVFKNLKKSKPVPSSVIRKLKMKVTIRCSNGDTFSIDNVDLDNTVEEFKQVVASHSNIPASDQRLIYRGKVLKDQATLKSYGVEEGLTIHLVRGKPSGAATTTSSTTTPSATSTTTTPPPSTTTSSNVPPSSTTTSTTTTNNTTSQTAPNQQQNPFSLFGNLGGFGGDNNNNMFGAGGFPNVDPNMMQQMMNNPFVQSMLNNPDFIREMMNSNPQMQQIMRNNPEVGRMLQDPEMIRRAMEMARNPELMREMMRNTDLAMSNIENLPGGFDALRRMYSDIQEPLHEATTEMFRGTTTTPEQPTTSNTTSVPPGQPFNMGK